VWPALFTSTVPIAVFPVNTVAGEALTVVVVGAGAVVVGALVVGALVVGALVGEGPPAEAAVFLLDPHAVAANANSRGMTSSMRREDMVGVLLGVTSRVARRLRKNWEKGFPDADRQLPGLCAGRRAGCGLFGC
jgi:hypothetical protein